MNKHWVNESVFYHIYPLGFVGAPKYNEGEKTAGSRILQVLDWIPHLKELGVNAVYFGPIFQSLKHGYDTSDYYETDSRLGTKEDFKNVFAALHEAGIRVVLDGVFNHVGRDFWAFKDVQQNLWNSPYKDWFCNLNFDGRSGMNDPFWYENWHGAWDLVKLNLWNPAVTDYLMDAVKMWIREFDIDGLRLDAADCVQKEFFKRLRCETKAMKPDFWLMGEIIHGDYRMWANPEMMDSVTNYEGWKGIYSSHNDKNYFEINYSMRRMWAKGGIYENLCLYNFLDNHDVNRIASMLKCKEDLKNVYTMLFTMPGVPSIYYGSEWGIEGVKGRGEDADYPLRPQLDFAEMKNKNPELIAHIRNLSELRKASLALQYGAYEEVLVRNEYMVFARNTGDDFKLVAFNVAETPVEMKFSYAGREFEITVKPHEAWISGEEK